MKVRRIQEIGGGTLFVSLPKRWAKRVGVQKGSIVSITERRDGSLIIDPYYREEEKRAEITINNPPLDRIMDEILGTYLLGYDLIKIRLDRGFTPNDYEIVRKSIRQLIGLEIIDENSHSVTIKCLLELTALSPSTVIARENILTRTMHLDAITSLLEDNPNLAEIVIKRDEEVNRLYFLLIRLLRAAVQNPKLADKLNLSPVDCLDYRVAASLIESIGDHSVTIAQHTLKLCGKRKPARILKLTSNMEDIASEMQGLALKAFLARDIKITGKVKESHEKLVALSDSIGELIVKQPYEIAQHFSAITSAIIEISNCIVDVADLAFEVREI
jgi:phosphate uptake regulator